MHIILEGVQKRAFIDRGLTSEDSNGDAYGSHTAVLLKQGARMLAGTPPTPPWQGGVGGVLLC